MSVPANQQRTFLQLVAALRPHWRKEPGLPARIQSLLAGRREFGSRDRRLYRELIYTTIRYLPWIEPLLGAAPDEAVRRVAWLAAETKATHAFRSALATGERPDGDKTELLPAWFRNHCPEIFAGTELETQLRRAPLWLRLQTTAAGRQRTIAEFASRGWEHRFNPTLPAALEMISEADVTQTDAWRDGLFEVQDLGSQMILESIGVETGGRWLDACAGAGGKTLQLARLLGPTGCVDASDIRPDALGELSRRAERARSAGVHGSAGATIRVLPVVADSSYDGVLVDAPCSGSGMWRRAPHLKWATAEVQVAAAAKIQSQLLGQFCTRLRPGGRLVYATCSLSRQENEDVVAEFLARHAEFRAEPLARTFSFIPRGHGLTLMPSRHDTDGFFVASLRRG